MRARVPDRESGTHDIEAGQDYGAVTAVFGGVPDRIRLTVEAPADSPSMFASLVAGTITDSGFEFYLSSAPESAGYKLHYVCDFSS